MLIAGCCDCGASEPGALGFSNDRSLVYCASTLSCGGGAASGGVPLPFAITNSPEASGQSGTVWRRSLPSGRRGAITASACGYHSPAMLDKQEHAAAAAPVG